MANFDVKYPDHYPDKCPLPSADKEGLETEHQYKAFFIAQYDDNDEYLKPVLEKYFNKKNWKLFNAEKGPKSGTKFCNVCRYALASDFGIASLSPLNRNVFQEIGLMIGLQKPLLYLCNPSRLEEEEKLPFDVGCQMYLEHRTKEELEQGLDKEIPLLIEKVELYSEYEKCFRKILQQKVDNLTSEGINILKLFLIENRPLDINSIPEDMATLTCLKKAGLIMKTLLPIGVKHSVNICYMDAWEVNPEYRDVLREIVFKKKEHGSKR